MAHAAVAVMSWLFTPFFLRIKQGIRVVDTVTWTIVEDVDKLNVAALELDWSNDGSWLALALANGTCLVVDTSHWARRLRLTPFEGHNADKDDDDDAVSKRHYYEDELSSRSTRLWIDNKVVTKFMETYSVFQASRDARNPPSSLALFMKCNDSLVLMIVWIRNNLLQREIDILSRADGGEPLSAILKVLSASTKLMATARRSDVSVRAVSGKFQLDQKDIRRLRAWNESLRSLDSQAPCVDTELLRCVDQVRY